MGKNLLVTCSAGHVTFIHVFSTSEQQLSTLWILGDDILTQDSAQAQPK